LLEGICLKMGFRAKAAKMAKEERKSPFENLRRVCPWRATLLPTRDSRLLAHVLPLQSAGLAHRVADFAEVLAVGHDGVEALHLAQ